MNDEFICDNCGEPTSEEFADPTEPKVYCFKCYEEITHMRKWAEAMRWFERFLPSMEHFVRLYCKKHKLPHEVEKLRGNCHPAAYLLYKILKGQAFEVKIKRGFWVGPIAGTNDPFRQHSWVACRPSDDFEFYILDPTQWVFTGEEPRIAICEEHDKRYDPAGHQVRSLRASTVAERKPEGLVKSKLSANAQIALSLAAGKRDWEFWTVDEVFDLANMNPARFGTAAKEIFRAIDRMGHKAFIPRESYEEIFNGGHHP